MIDRYDLAAYLLRHALLVLLCLVLAAYVSVARAETQLVWSCTAVAADDDGPGRADGLMGAVPVCARAAGRVAAVIFQPER